MRTLLGRKDKPIFTLNNIFTLFKYIIINIIEILNGTLISLAGILSLCGPRYCNYKAVDIFTYICTSVAIATCMQACLRLSASICI